MDGHDQKKVSGAKRRIGAPTFKFVPRHCPNPNPHPNPDDAKQSCTGDSKANAYRMVLIASVNSTQHGVWNSDFQAKFQTNR